MSPIYVFVDRQPKKMKGGGLFDIRFGQRTRMRWGFGLCPVGSLPVGLLIGAWSISYYL